MALAVLAMMVVPGSEAEAANEVVSRWQPFHSVQRGLAGDTGSKHSLSPFLVFAITSMALALACLLSTVS